MHSAALDLPDAAILQRFCDEQGVPATSLCKVGWALVLQRFFYVTVFRFHQATNETLTISYEVDLAERSSVFAALQACPVDKSAALEDCPPVLHSSNAVLFDEVGPRTKSVVCFKTGEECPSCVLEDNVMLSSHVLLS